MTQWDVYRNGIAAVHAAAVGEDQVHMTAAVADPEATPADAAESLYGKVAGVLTQSGTRIVHERLFGSLAVRPEVLATRDRVLSAAGIEPERPVTWIEGRPPWGDGLAGVQIHALRPPEDKDAIWNIEDDGAVCGHGWTRHGTTFLLLQNLHGLGDPSGSVDTPSQEAHRMFERARRILEQHGAAFRHVVRTWIYLADILDWYGPFNAVRNARYRAYGLFEDGDAGRPALPASTGIAGRNPMGAACTMDLLAVVPTGPLTVEPVSNTRQNEAYEYGSAFSRAMLVREPDVAHLLVSGTAAIDEAGSSLHEGDAAAQIRRTVENVQALVARADASLADTVEATVFLKRAEDAPVWEAVAREMGLADMPAVVVVADVCRDELLFEFDSLVEFTPG